MASLQTCIRRTGSTTNRTIFSPLSHLSSTNTHLSRPSLRYPPQILFNARTINTQPPRFYAWSRYQQASGSKTRSGRREGATRRSRESVVPNASVVESTEAVAAGIPLPDSAHAEQGLQRLLQNDVLVVVRQIEMMNIFMGFEQANRYAITDIHGNHVGYMAEGHSFFGTFARQLFRTHRAFKSTIMDRDGSPILQIDRPFAWINSRLFVRRNGDSTEDDQVTLGEVQQEWHPWRRRYDLFTGRLGDFHQFARVDEGLWAWHFHMQNEQDVNIASVKRDFTGLGREIFTDTGQYVIRFAPDPEAPSNQRYQQEQQLKLQSENAESGAYDRSGSTAVADLAVNEIVLPRKRLSLEERAAILALSVSIDFDYFSRHSEGRGPGLWTMLWAWGE